MANICIPCLQAEIYRWDTFELIPGTEGVWPGPGAQLDQRQLEYARLSFVDLNGAHFDDSNLAFADLSKANITNASFLEANVTGANFYSAGGFTKEQLYSTASYRAQSLRGVVFGSESWQQLSEWSFRDQDLTGAHFSRAFIGEADFDGAIINNTNFSYATTLGGLSAEQFYSTASYHQAKNLQGVILTGNDLTDWDFQGQDLTNARFDYATLAGIRLDNALITGANFYYTSNFGAGIMKELVYPTASYKLKNLRGVNFGANDLRNWDFSGQNLANAKFENAWLDGAVLDGAIIKGADFNHSSLTREQLYETESYRAKDLGAMRLDNNFLRGWNFNGQSLINARFYAADLVDARFIGADLKGATFGSATLTNVVFTGADLRHAKDIRVDVRKRNVIQEYGHVSDLRLTAGQEFLVRDDDVTIEGYAPFQIGIYGSLSMAEGSTMRVILEADEWDSTIYFVRPDVPVALGGTLELTFANDVDIHSQEGRSFKIFDWSGVAFTGSFTVQSEYLWDLSSLYSNGEVTLDSAGTVGDANGDGLVGIEDLNSVRNHFGESGAPGILGDTIPFDGHVNVADLNAVRNHFGGSNTATVPEPSTLVIAATGLLALLSMRQSKRKR